MLATAEAQVHAPIPATAHTREIPSGFTQLQELLQGTQPRSTMAVQCNLKHPAFAAVISQDWAIQMGPKNAYGYTDHLVVHAKDGSRPQDDLRVERVIGAAPLDRVHLRGRHVQDLQGVPSVIGVARDPQYGHTAAISRHQVHKIIDHLAEQKPRSPLVGQLEAYANCIRFVGE